MARPKSDHFKRFSDKILKVGSGCHEWQSTIDRDGYGRFYFDGAQEKAHRMAYRLFVGNPGELAVLHRCDNRKCVNPDHLFLGTIQDNVRDMDAKGRRGTRAKLSRECIKEVLSLLPEHSQQFIAERFGVDQTTISRIKLSAQLNT